MAGEIGVRLGIVPEKKSPVKKSKKEGEAQTSPSSSGK